MQRALLELANDNGANTTQKAIFVRFIIHVIGDMHQPLHNTNLYNNSYPSPNGDLGGNAESIIDLKGRSMYLHSYWDQGC